MSKELTPRRLNVTQDLDGVLRLFEMVFQRPASPQTWRWKYLSHDADPHVWVFTMDRRIVAHIGAVRLQGQEGGQDVPFFLFGDMMVDPCARGAIHSWSTAYSRILQEIHHSFPNAFMYGFAGERVARFHNRLGNSMIIEEAEDRLIRLDDTNTEATGSIDVRPWDWSEAPLDVLWEQLRETVPFGLVRDRNYLHWRYAHHPTYTYCLWGVYERECPVGWLVTERCDLKSAELLEEVRVLDLLLPRDSRMSVLSAACRVVRAKTLVLWLARQLWPATFESRQTGWVVLENRAGSGHVSRSDRRGLFYTLGEADEWWW